MRTLMTGLLIAGLLFGGAAAGSSLLDKAKERLNKDKAKPAGQASPAGSPADEKTVTAGLKEALSIGSQKAVEAVAKELVELYARRRALRGHTFSPGGEWEEEFEKIFEYDEPEDQLRSIREIFADMEEGAPMDRLLCGDVGYGKTEVAMRAAFKAVMDGKQVAVLCPTTVLASQHLKTFRERMLLFPVRVEALTRLQSAREQKAVVDALRAGFVDIVIGTHRLLSKDIAFKDLGLLVVDEEQRFGVGHKEKIKQLRATIDVLTLTATPIPRTLNMSLSGLRDISLIETPPRDRLAVHTVVTPFSAKLIAAAVRPGRPAPSAVCAATAGKCTRGLISVASNATGAARAVSVCSSPYRRSRISFPSCRSRWSPKSSTTLSSSARSWSRDDRTRAASMAPATSPAATTSRPAFTARSSASRSRSVSRRMWVESRSASPARRDARSTIAATAPASSGRSPERAAIVPSSRPYRASASVERGISSSK